MKNIDEALNEIIFKYSLDKYYPHYRNMYEAEKILRDIIYDIQQNKRKAVFVGDDKSQIAFVRNISRDYADIQFVSYDRDNRTLQELSVIDWNKFDEVFLISFYGAEYVERWFRLQHVQYQWVYDIFEKNELFLQREFFAFGKEDLYPLVETNELSIHTRYGWTESLLCELYCQQSKYQATKNSATKRIALEKCLFLTIYMKDFVKAQEYISVLSKEEERFKNAWMEIQALLDAIRDVVSNRQQEDIILFWLDAIPFGDEKIMPYLQSVMKAGVTFENAYTYINNTNPTLRAMFLGKKDIDDKGCLISKITQENSPVLKFLEEQGYNVRIVSGSFCDKFPYQYISEHFYTDWYDPCSMRLWDMLGDMLLQERKTLYVVHALEAHAPYLSSNINDTNAFDRKERYRLARIKLDEQLEFYESFINQKVIRMYMSDHGQADVVQQYTGYHVLFSIYKRTWTPGKINGFVSLLDFDKVLKQVIMYDDMKEEEFVREYVEIGRMDRYNRRHIGKIIKNQKGLSTTHFGYTGIIDKDYIYIRYKIGKEWLQNWKHMPMCNPLMVYDCVSDVCDPELLPKYRALAGVYPAEDIEREEQFKYIRYLYDVYNNILRHNDMHKRANIINEMLADYPENSVVIRLGGYHSAMLYYILSEESKKRIYGFVDNSEECLCSKLRLPIIAVNCVEELKKAGIKAILLSSYINLDFLRKEAENWQDTIDVLDMYDCLAKNGIKCKDNFWVIEGISEDYDVKFPFD